MKKNPLGTKVRGKKVKDHLIVRVIRGVHFFKGPGISCQFPLTRDDSLDEVGSRVDVVLVLDRLAPDLGVRQRRVFHGAVAAQPEVGIVAGPERS